MPSLQLTHDYYTIFGGHSYCLKTFIKKHYQLTGTHEQIKMPGYSPGTNRTKKALFDDLAQGMAPRTPALSFKEITENLSSFIRKERKTETFSTMLDRLRKEKGMTPAQLYNGAWIKKQLYSKIMGERNYHPSKNTVIAFGMSLKLNREEIDRLLESAGYKFSNSSIADLVVMFCLNNGLHDLHDVNALLLSADQKVLCREWQFR